MSNTSKGRVVFIRQANPTKDGVAVGKVTAGDQIYVHSWPTGHQELLFNNTQEAKIFAEKNECEFVGKK